MEYFRYGLTKSGFPCILLKFGDINNIADLIRMAHKHHKRILLYLDAIRGLTKDPSAIEFLSRIGVDAIATINMHCIRTIKKAGIPSLLSVFLIDSEATKTGLRSIQQAKPDALNLMPASIPARVIRQIKENTDIPITAGGLIREREEVQKAISKGISAVITSEVRLWDSGKRFS